jgi:hypothetical protein
MQKTEAKIRKVGNRFCVFSKDGSRKFGCFSSRELAVKRLQQIEYFKQTKGTEDMNNEYNDAFTNMAKALRIGEDADPEVLGTAPESHPRQINVRSTLGLNGTIAGQKSTRILDQREHFPVTTEIQARSSMVRAMRMSAVPNWYNGTLDNLREEVWVGVLTKHPSLAQGLKVPVTVEHALALSDGQESATTSKTSIKDPADVRKNEVDSVKRPTITTASNAAKALADQCQDLEQRKVIANNLIEMIGKQEEAIKKAKKVATRLMKDGLTADEFEELNVYLQEDILRSLMMRGVVAAPTNASERRLELLERLGKKVDE